MVELNEKALEAAEVAWRASVSATCKLMLRDAIRAYFAALPAPDDGQKKTEKFTLLAMASNYRGGHSWDHLDGKVCERAAAEIDAKDTALQSQAAELQHLRADAANPDKGMWTFWNEKARKLSEQIERQKRSIQELEESVSALEAERQNIIATKREQIERLTRERDEALDRHSSAVMGEIEATQRAEAAEQQVQELTAENERLREALNLIDALDPEEHIYGVSHDACRGLIIRMGEIARAALDSKEDKK